MHNEAHRNDKELFFEIKRMIDWLDFLEALAGMVWAYFTTPGNTSDLSSYFGRTFADRLPSQMGTQARQKARARDPSESAWNPSLHPRGGR